MDAEANKNAFDIVTIIIHGFILSIKKFKRTRQQFKLRTKNILINLGNVLLKTSL